MPSKGKGVTMVEAIIVIEILAIIYAISVAN